MPIIYLSPSTQEGNLYVTGGGSEEYYMNLLADRLEPYLLSSGIQYRRNRPDMTAGSSVRESNAGEYDLHLALHSNAAPPGRYGTARGIIAFYYPDSREGERAADLIADELREIYPLTSRVTTQATTRLGEVRLPNAPAVLVEIGYHDNPEDAVWVEGHLEAIAQQLARALTRFFGLPFIYPMEMAPGVVDLDYGALNLREKPSHTAPILAQMPDGAEIAVYGEWQGWYLVHYGDWVGYAAAAYINL
ncbi:MAG: N-acetylmuramoyl-L-alanine amidase [Oscillibacter sp.]